MRLSKITEEYLEEFVYGSIDGTVTTFAVVAAAAGGGIRPGIVIIFGVSNLIADGISMGISAYLSERSGDDQYQKQRRAVVKLLEGGTTKSINTIKRHLKRYGLKDKALDQAVSAIASDPEKATDFIMKEEHELIPESRTPAAMGAVTFAAFVIAGIVPLLPYLAAWIFDLNWTGPTQFAVACGITALSFTLIGALKSHVAHAPRTRSVAETLVLGGVAAGLAYAVGAWLNSIGANL